MLARRIWSILISVEKLCKHNTYDQLSKFEIDHTSELRGVQYTRNCFGARKLLLVRRRQTEWKEKKAERRGQVFALLKMVESNSSSVFVRLHFFDIVCAEKPTATADVDWLNWVTSSVNFDKLTRRQMSALCIPIEYIETTQVEQTGFQVKWLNAKQFLLHTLYKKVVTLAKTLDLS